MNTHTGNIQPALDYEEHLSIGGVNAKAVMVFDNAGNQITSFGGGSGQATVAINSLVTLGASPAFIGLVTVANTVPTTFSGNVTLDDGSLTGIVGNVTLSDAKTFIGLTTTTLGASSAFVGLVTVANTVPTTFSGNITLDDGSLTGIVGNVTISDSKGFIGLVSVSGFANPMPVSGTFWQATQPVSFAGNVTLDVGSKTGIVGNVTLSDSKGFIGLATVQVGTIAAGDNNIGNVDIASALPTGTNAIGKLAANSGIDIGDVDILSIAAGDNNIGNVDIVTLPALVAGTANIGDVDVLSIAAGANYIGLASVNIGGTLPALSAGAAYVGLVTVANTVPVTFSGNVTLDDGSLTGLIAGANYIGLATIDIGSNNNVAIKGNVTLSDSKTFIGLATIVPTFIAGYTSFSTVISALATIVVPPSGQKIFVRNLHVSSLGRAELSLWSVNATATVNRLPWTSLSTTSGMAPYYGENGMQWAAANDGLTVALNGAATVSVMADVRFSA